MPKDVVLRAAVISITGNFEVCIGNYRGITEYTDSLVRIRTKGGQIRITGLRLHVEYYTNDEMKVTGRIDAISFDDGGKEV